MNSLPAFDLRGTSGLSRRGTSDGEADSSAELWGEPCSLDQQEKKCLHMKGSVEQKPSTRCCGSFVLHRYDRGVSFNTEYGQRRAPLSPVFNLLSSLNSSTIGLLQVRLVQLLVNALAPSRPADAGVTATRECTHLLLFVCCTGGAQSPSGKGGLLETETCGIDPLFFTSASLLLLWLLKVWRWPAVGRLLFVDDTRRYISWCIAPKEHPRKLVQTHSWTFVFNLSLSREAFPSLTLLSAPSCIHIYSVPYVLHPGTTAAVRQRAALRLEYLAQGHWCMSCSLFPDISSLSGGLSH